MQVKTSFLLIVFLSAVYNTFSQELSYIDSLKQELQKCKNATDSTRILCQLTWDIPESNPNERIYYGGLALKTAEKTNDSALISRACDAMALTFRLQGDNEKAIQYYQRSLNIGRRNKIDERIAWGNFNLASVYVKEGRFALALTSAKEASRYFTKIGELERVLESYRLLAKIEPEMYTDTVCEIIIKNLPNETNETDRIFQYLDLTYLYNNIGNRNRAMYFVQQAMELAEKNKNTKGIIKAYFQIAGYFRNVQKNYSLALTYYEKILELIQQNNLDAKMADIYSQIGDVYRLTGNDSIALTYFNKALEIGKKNKHRHTMASAYMKLGEVSYSHKDYHDALYYYLKCHNTNCDVCPPIVFHDVLINIGNVYLFSEDTKNAMKYYQMSLELADSAVDKKAKSRSLQAYANFFEGKGELNKAIEYHVQAYDIAEESEFIEGQYISASSLSSLYAKINNHQKAFDFLKQANLLSDSMKKANEIDNLAKLETYFDFKNLQVQRELDKTKSEEEISRQKLLRNSFIVGFILVALLGFIVYISYRRKRKDNKVLHEQKVAIENMSKKVHEADQAKLQFFMNVSHEFKTPLTLILGMTEKLRALVKNGSTISIIRKNSLKLLQLVNHLLDLRKIDTKMMALKVNEGNIKEFLNGIIASFDNMAEQKQIKLEFAPDKSITSAFFDQDKMEKIFSNLLSNAIKYTPNEGLVRVSTMAKDNGYIEITVSDSGVGIPESEMKNIFTRFYRVSDNSNLGSGIGLALVKELVELHKGEVSVNCKSIQGSCFKVTIPMQQKFYTREEMNNVEHESTTWSYVDILDVEENANIEIQDVVVADSDKKNNSYC